MNVITETECQAIPAGWTVGDGYIAGPTAVPGLRPEISDFEAVWSDGFKGFETIHVLRNVINFVLGAYALDENPLPALRRNFPALKFEFRRVALCSATSRPLYLRRQSGGDIDDEGDFDGMAILADQGDKTQHNGYVLVTA